MSSPSHSPLRTPSRGGSLTWARIPRHESENMASLSCPDCGVNLPHTADPDDDLPTPTISQRFIAAGSDPLNPAVFCPNRGAPVSDAADRDCVTRGDPLRPGRR